MIVQHHVDTKWYIPSYHDKFSAGWNRSIESGFLMKPYACHIRFYGVGLEENMLEFKSGGTGYIFGRYRNKLGACSNIR